MSETHSMSQIVRSFKSQQEEFRKQIQILLTLKGDPLEKRWDLYKNSYFLLKTASTFLTPVCCNRLDEHGGGPIYIEKYETRSGEDIIEAITDSFYYQHESQGGYHLDRWCEDFITRVSATLYPDVDELTSEQIEYCFQIQINNLKEEILASGFCAFTFDW